MYDIIADLLASDLALLDEMDTTIERVTASLVLPVFEYGF